MKVAGLLVLHVLVACVVRQGGGSDAEEVRGPDSTGPLTGVEAIIAQQQAVSLRRSATEACTEAEGRHNEGIAQYKEVAGIYTSLYGPDHESVGQTLLYEAECALHAFSMRWDDGHVDRLGRGLHRKALQEFGAQLIASWDVDLEFRPESLAVYHKLDFMLGNLSEVRKGVAAAHDIFLSHSGKGNHDNEARCKEMLAGLDITLELLRGAEELHQADRKALEGSLVRRYGWRVLFVSYLASFGYVVADWLSTPGGGGHFPWASAMAGAAFAADGMDFPPWVVVAFLVVGLFRGMLQPRRAPPRPGHVTAAVASLPWRVAVFALNALWWAWAILRWAAGGVAAVVLGRARQLRMWKEGYRRYRRQHPSAAVAAAVAAAAAARAQERARAPAGADRDAGAGAGAGAGANRRRRMTQGPGWDGGGAGGGGAGARAGAGRSFAGAQVAKARSWAVALCSWVVARPRRLKSWLKSLLAWRPWPRRRTAAVGARAVPGAGAGARRGPGAGAGGEGGAAESPSSPPLSPPHWAPAPAPDAAAPGDAEEDVGRCVICIDAPAVMACVPCGHQCLCKPCGRQLKQCPMCRKRVVSIIKVFKSGA